MKAKKNITKKSSLFKSLVMCKSLTRPTWIKGIQGCCCKESKQFVHDFNTLGLKKMYAMMTNISAMYGYRNINTSVLSCH